MGHRRLLDELRIVLAHKDDRFGRQACQNLHKQGGMALWDSNIHCLGSGSQVHLPDFGRAYSTPWGQDWI